MWVEVVWDESSLRFFDQEMIFFENIFSLPVTYEFYKVFGAGVRSRSSASVLESENEVIAGLTCSDHFVMNRL